MERSRSHTSSITLRNPTHVIACTEETSDNRETSCQKKTNKKKPFGWMNRFHVDEQTLSGRKRTIDSSPTATGRWATCSAEAVPDDPPLLLPRSLLYTSKQLTEGGASLLNKVL